MKKILLLLLVALISVVTGCSSVISQIDNVVLNMDSIKTPEVSEANSDKVTDNTQQQETEKIHVETLTQLGFLDIGEQPYYNDGEKGVWISVQKVAWGHEKDEIKCYIPYYGEVLPIAISFPDQVYRIQTGLGYYIYNLKDDSIKMEKYRSYEAFVKDYNKYVANGAEPQDGPREPIYFINNYVEETFGMTVSGLFNLPFDNRE